MVEQVGVRELRRDLSEYLRRVERGESFAVTSRGRAVALLGPSPEKRDALARLVLERQAVPARIDVLERQTLGRKATELALPPVTLTLVAESEREAIDALAQ